MAHQIINTGSRELRYLALSTPSEVDVCEYLDFDKRLVVADDEDGGLWKVFRSEVTLEYYSRESGGQQRHACPQRTRI